MPEKLKLRFTNIQHRERLALGLSLTEYCIADSIYHLSNNSKSKVPYWCNSTKAYLGKFIGISEQSVHTILNKLCKLHLIERHKTLNVIRTTPKWYNSIVVAENLEGTKETLVPSPEDTKETLASDTKETLVNIDIRNKDINTDICPGGPILDKMQNSGKIKDSGKDIPEHNSPDLSSLSISLNSVSPPDKKVDKVKKLTEEGLRVFQKYKERISGNCKQTAKHILEGIPRAIKMFKEDFQEAGVDNLIIAIDRYTKQDNFINTKNDPKYVYAYMPKTFFSKTFIETKLLPIINQNTNGNVHDEYPSKEGVRKIEELNSGIFRQWDKHHSKPEGTNIRVPKM
jgi:hypothetical protein